MYSLSLSVATPSAVVHFEYTTTRVSSDHNSHTFCYFCFVFLKRYLFCCLWWVGLFFSLLHPLLQCFLKHLRSIQDVSNWNTGAVTSMQLSKCTLSLLLCGHDAFRSVVFVNYTTTRDSSAHNSYILTRFFFLLFQSVLQQWLHTITLRWRMGIVIVNHICCICPIGN